MGWTSYPINRVACSHFSRIIVKFSLPLKSLYKFLLRILFSLRIIWGNSMREDSKIPRMLYILRMTLMGAIYFENDVDEDKGIGNLTVFHIELF